MCGLLPRGDRAGLLLVPGRGGGGVRAGERTLCLPSSPRWPSVRPLGRFSLSASPLLLSLWVRSLSHGSSPNSETGNLHDVEPHGFSIKTHFLFGAEFANFFYLFFFFRLIFWRPPTCVFYSTPEPRPPQQASEMSLEIFNDVRHQALPERTRRARAGSEDHRSLERSESEGRRRRGRGRGRCRPAARVRRTTSW